MLLAGLLVLASATFMGLLAQRRDIGQAVQGYQQLRQLYEVGSHLVTARRLLSLDRPESTIAERELIAARLLIDDFADVDVTAITDDQRLISPKPAPEQSSNSMPLPADRLAKLRDLHHLIDVVINSPHGLRLESLDDAMGQIVQLVADIRLSVSISEQAAQDRYQETLIAILVIAVIILVVACLVAIRHYRSILRPLHQVQQAVQVMAGGNLAQRVQPVGPKEFADLARDFNRMADELQDLYQDLENQVSAKSMQLVRSERLAGVGYLAAGVAHEINNPLGIISGYAEMQLEMLKKLPCDNPGKQEVIQNLSIIAEEAFRCREIIDRLLLLARSDEQPAVVDLARVAQNVVQAARGLQQGRNHTIELHCGDQGPASILASEAELKQVVLNLIVNALQACEQPGGRVMLEVSRQGQQVRLTVTDNGKGMTAATIERIFSPFYTESRGPGARGVGLGLSITHAIVDHTGGSIQAISPGPGLGSTFIVDFPLATSAGDVTKSS